jgi:hypothetical protein
MRSTAARAREARFRGRDSLVAVTRHPELVPPGRRAVRASRPLAGAPHGRGRCPRVLRRARRGLCHTQYALPLRPPCPCVVTVHDVSFAREPELMGGRIDCLPARRAARGSSRSRVLTVSERTKRTSIELYACPRAHRRHAERRRPRLLARSGRHDYVPRVGAIQPRKNQLAALDAPRRSGCRSSSPARQGSDARAELRDGARGSRATSRRAPRRALPRRGVPRAAEPLRGLRPPVVEAMASGRRSSPSRSGARGGAGGARARRRSDLAAGIRTALAERDRLVAAGLERVRRSAGATAPSGRSPSTGRYSGREGLGRRRLARALRTSSALAVRARPAGRRDARDRESARLRRRRAAERAGPREPAPLSLAANVNLGIAATTGEYVLNVNPDAIAEPDAVARSSRSPTRIRAADRGPQMRWPDGSWQPSAGAFRPSAARSCDGRRSAASPARTRRSASTTTLDERPTSPCRPTGCSARSCSCARRCSTRSAAGTPASGTTARTSTSATARRRRVGSAGTCPGRRHARVRGRHRRALPLAAHAVARRGMARFVRKHPERLLAL